MRSLQAIRVAVLAVLILTVPAIAAAATSPVNDYTVAFRQAGVTIDRLEVLEVGVIVVIRGRTTDARQAEQASEVARTLGFSRVANLVQLLTAPDDAEIGRQVERTLASHRSLEGCELSVQSQRGVVHVAGKIHNDLQKDVAIQLVRRVDGVRGVSTDLRRF